MAAHFQLQSAGVDRSSNVAVSSPLDICGGRDTLLARGVLRFLYHSSLPPHPLRVQDQPSLLHVRYAPNDAREPQSEGALLIR